MSEEFFEVVVVGSGFGGAVTACRAAQAGRNVLVLERGKLYQPEELPARPLETSTGSWDPSEGLFGLFQVWSFRQLDAVVSSGVGGGSLVYADVMSRMPEAWFSANAQDWPLEYAHIEEHYGTVEKMMSPQSASLALACTESGQRPGDPFAAAGDRDPGCDDGSENALDFTYLSQAQRCGAEIRPLHEVKRITAVSGGYELDYVVHRPVDPPWEPLRRPPGTRPTFKRVKAKTVVVAAGALGSTWLLLVNRPGLPCLSGQLGTRFSGSNGDAVGFLKLTSGRLDLEPLSDWPTDRSREYLRDLWKTMTTMGRASRSRLHSVISSLLSRTTTVAPLGGCPMGQNAMYGVVDRYGEAFGHPGLFVADGSVLPAPVGANPALTIAALAERFADRIVERSQ
ncbi:MAG: GMC family oxidoreductase [Pseudonocardiaceae bacterium]